MNSRRMERVRRRSFDFECSAYVDPVGIGGGLAVWWRNGLKIQILSLSRNIIHLVVSAGFWESPCFVTLVYAPPSQGSYEFWRKLNLLKFSMEEDWVIFGDYNDILCHAKKDGGDFRSDHSFVRFLGWMVDCDLMDMEFKDNAFTWSNGQKDGDFIRERLDRVVCTVGFRRSYPLAMVLHVEMIRSDHSLLVIDLFYKNVRRPKRFKFESFWVENKSIVIL